MKVLLAILTFCSMQCFAQPDEQAVKHTINNLFDGMRKVDGELIKSAFAQNAILQTITKNKEGKTLVRSMAADTFIAMVTKPHKELYDERIQYEMIKIDGDLATVWTPYQFYVDDKLSHCGVNSFQLVKLAGTWKIQYLIDTRRKEDCQ